jgi:hypothetical protein
MGKLLSELREADGVLEAQGIGGQEGFELLACGKQGPGLCMGVAVNPPRAAGRHARAHGDQAESGRGPGLVGDRLCGCHVFSDG